MTKGVTLVYKYQYGEILGSSINLARVISTGFFVVFGGFISHLPLMGRYVSGFFVPRISKPDICMSGYFISKSSLKE